MGLTNQKENDMKVLEYDASGKLVGVRESRDLTDAEWARVKQDKSGALRPEKDET